MGSPSWTIKDLEALESAIAQGILRVEYSDKKIQYRSLSEMMTIRDKMRRDLGLVDRKTVRLYSQHSKGIDGC